MVVDIIAVLAVHIIYTHVKQKEWLCVLVSYEL